MKRLAVLALAAASTAAPALAQPYGYRQPVLPGPYGFILGDPNNTGGQRAVIIPRGATGADTVFSSSAIGGNASRPELAIPNGSAGGGGGNR